MPGAPKALVESRCEDAAMQDASANMFDLIAARAPRPEKLAMETPVATSLTYGALFERSARAANALVALGVEPSARVAVQVDKSTDVIVADGRSDALHPPSCSPGPDAGRVHTHAPLRIGLGALPEEAHAAWRERTGFRSWNATG